MYSLKSLIKALVQAPTIQCKRGLISFNNRHSSHAAEGGLIKNTTTQWPYSKISIKKIGLLCALSAQILMSACSTPTPAPVSTRPAQGSFPAYPSATGYPSNPYQAAPVTTIPNTAAGVGAYPVNNAYANVNPAQVQIQPYAPYTPYTAPAASYSPYAPNPYATAPIVATPAYNNPPPPYTPPKPAVVPINSSLNPTPAINNTGAGFNAPQISNINEPVPNGYYRAMPGDTLYKIARTYNLQPRDLLTWNNLENPNQLNLYQLVRITPPYTSNTSNAGNSSGSTSAVSNTSTATNPITPIPANNNKANSALGGAPNLIWPIKNGRIVRKFDQKSVDIAGREGDIVTASADGKVLFANTMRGYGKLVVINHAGSLITAYANLGHITVRDQQSVKQGQTLGLISAPNAGETAKIQFQVRENSKAVDPATYLPR